MSNHILVDKGALQMLRNAVKRIAREQDRTVLLEILEEVDKSCINVTEFKLVDGPHTKRGWSEDKVYGTSDLDARQCSRFPPDICKEG